MSSRFPPQEGEGPSDRPAVTQTRRDSSTIASSSSPISTRVDHDRVSQPILSMILLEHPEDLGRAKSGGEPGSIWRWKSLKDLAARPGVTWGALAQLSLGAASVKPTRLLTNIPKVINWLNLGPPVFGGTGKYMGPLPFTQAPAGPLIGKTDSSFRTQSAAQWPPQMCQGVAEGIFEAIDIDECRENDTKVTVLYLFSGRRREDSVRSYLENLAETNRVKIEITDLDLLYGADLLNKVGQKRLLEKVASGQFMAVLASPP